MYDRLPSIINFTISKDVWPITRAIVADPRLTGYLKIVWKPWALQEWCWLVDAGCNILLNNGSKMVLFRIIGTAPTSISLHCLSRSHASDLSSLGGGQKGKVVASCTSKNQKALATSILSPDFWICNLHMTCRYLGPRWVQSASLEF